MPEKGKSLIRSDDEWDVAVDAVLTGLLTAVMLLAFFPLLPVVQSAQRYFTNQSYQGDVETKILHATGTLQYWDLVNSSPYVPLISAFFINRGANRVFIGINAAMDWLEIWPGETRTVSHVGADTRIERIYYRCDFTLTSLIEAEGHF